VRKIGNGAGKPSQYDPAPMREIEAAARAHGISEGEQMARFMRWLLGEVAGYRQAPSYEDMISGMKALTEKFRLKEAMRGH